MRKMPTRPELNEPSRRTGARELREFLVSASNSLYLFELLSDQTGRPVSAALRRAHSSIRAEAARLRRELQAGD